MIHPIRHLSLRGIIWYQRESNRLDGSIYTHLSKAMLEGWRKDFDQGPLPFYFVQMPPYTWGEEPGSDSYARFREAQEAILKVENTGMIVTMDVRSEEHTSELKSLMRSSYAVFCLKTNKNK